MWRRPVIYAIGLLTPALFVVELTVLTGTGLAHTGGYADPFAPYEAIMPGQPTAALEQYPCQFGRGYELEIEPTVCRIHPGEGPFLLVTIYFEDDLIQQVVFIPQGLRVGDLVERWGRPAVNQNGKGLFFIRWRRTLYALTAPTGLRRHFNYLLPVDLLVIADELLS